MASSYAIPIDLVLFLFLQPIGVQVILKGVSLQGILIMWSFILSSVIYSLLYVSNRLEILTIILVAVLFINSSIEIERHSRFHFYTCKAYQKIKSNEIIMLQEKQKYELELKNQKLEIQMIEMTAEVCF